MTDRQIEANEADNIRIRLVELSDGDDVLNFLRKHFYPEEPLCSSSQKPPHPEDEAFNISLIAHGTCLMAVQQQIVNGIRRERIVGVLLSGPKHSDEAEHLFKEAARLRPTDFGKAIGILAHAERDSNVFERYNVERALHIYAGAVDGSFRGRAISIILKEKLKELGRQLGYSLLTTDCTSFYSAKVSERMGMDCVNVIKYADYLDEEGKVVFNMPLPHEYLKTYALRL
ncbi:arylalkylamine N-acetyltransferase-like 2 [Zeugodacus cucurbitae]|uniref:arylalkylamine N-acetyltransferase-like 2 n=1 Tax=Zeugodacus cucurbitae TaxID=28588 RepID=UPI0023D919EB|nr:arylalkylamine N-acetyltransferase-like 2 [Zeugodacus cucurbitae]